LSNVPSLFCFRVLFLFLFFFIGSDGFLGPALNQDPPTYASHVAGITECTTTPILFVGIEGFTTLCLVGLEPQFS
jgi:hypothetical protein